jgi:hypothetical protein
MICFVAELWNEKSLVSFDQEDNCPPLGLCCICDTVWTDRELGLGFGKAWRIVNLTHAVLASSLAKRQSTHKYTQERGVKSVWLCGD